MNYKKGDIILGKVTGIENYGVFLSFENGYSGLIHISEISDSYINDINDIYKIGDEITAKILSVEENNHYKLSIKEMKTKSKKEKKIKETKTGFSTLSNKLNEWIEEYEYNNNKDI